MWSFSIKSYVILIRLNKNFKPPDVLPLQNNKVAPPFRENFKIMEGMNLRNVNDPLHKSSRSKLGKCQGDCDGDKQCKPGLKCFERSGYTKVPGCEGRGKRDWDYCIDADLINDPKPEPPVWARGKGKRGGGYKEKIQRTSYIYKRRIYLSKLDGQ